jgi:Ribonuclease G/E
MSERRYFLDRGIGEDRAVVTLDGRPERLLLARESGEQRVQLGARLIGRVRHIEPAFGAAFLDLGGGVEAILPFKPDEKPVGGASLEVEIRGEPRRGKLAVLRAIGPGDGAPRLIKPAPSLADRLSAMARGAPVVAGAEARLCADEAESDALAVVHLLPGGGDLAIEPTRALTAIDIDLGERKGGDPKRITRQANLVAIGASARLLRLKGIGGLVVIDLVGRGHDGPALMTAARTAFAPDNPGVAIGPITKFGTMELSIPRRSAPLHETLLRADGSPSDETLALRLVRDIQSQARAEPGARLVAAARPEIAKLAAPLVDRLAQEVGRRVSVEPASDAPRDRIDVRIV